MALDLSFLFLCSGGIGLWLHFFVAMMGSSKASGIDLFWEGIQSQASEARPGATGRGDQQ